MASVYGSAKRALLVCYEASQARSSGFAPKRIGQRKETDKPHAYPLIKAPRGPLTVLRCSKRPAKALRRPAKRPAQLGKGRARAAHPARPTARCTRLPATPMGAYALGLVGLPTAHRRPYFRFHFPLG